MIDISVIWVDAAAALITILLGEVRRGSRGSIAEILRSQMAAWHLTWSHTNVFQETLTPKMLSAKPPAVIATLMTPNDAATVLKVSLSWLAKARMRGDGPPYIRVGRSIRYADVALVQWMKSRQRSSTSEL